MEDDIIPSGELAKSIRSVIDCYFGSDNKGQQLVKHQLDSYNDFISRKLEQIIDGFNPIDLYNTYIPEVGCFRHIVSISMSNPTVSKPTICEKDGSTKVMLPNDARLRNMTYAAPLTVDVTLTAKTYLPETGEYSMETKRMDGVNLGRVPVMVRSRYCVLSQQQVPSEADECRYDYGGYFVINGNEKVVISQDRIAENRTYVFLNTKATCYSHVAEIRSVQEARFGVPKTTALKLSSKANQFGRCVRVTMHHIKHDVPLFIIFRALGITSDREIVQHIVYDLEDLAGAAVARELSGCMDEASCVRTQQQAHDYLLAHMHTHGHPREIASTGPHRAAALRNVLKKDFLPHVGPDSHKKALYLGYMVSRLMRSYLKLAPLDDRDSYINKRLDTPGVLVANLFRQYYGAGGVAPPCGADLWGRGGGRCWVWYVFGNSCIYPGVYTRWYRLPHHDKHCNRRQGHQGHAHAAPEGHQRGRLACRQARQRAAQGKRLQGDQADGHRVGPQVRAGYRQLGREDEPCSPGGRAGPEPHDVCRHAIAPATHQHADREDRQAGESPLLRINRTLPPSLPASCLPPASLLHPPSCFSPQSSLLLPSITHDLSIALPSCGGVPRSGTTAQASSYPMGSGVSIGDTGRRIGGPRQEPGIAHQRDSCDAV
jgi:hypothetical protein